MLQVTTKVDRFGGVGTLRCRVCGLQAAIPPGLSLRFTFASGDTDLLKVMTSLERRFYIAHRCGVAWLFECPNCGDGLVSGSEAVKPDVQGMRRHRRPAAELTTRPACARCGEDMEPKGPHRYVSADRLLPDDLVPLPRRDPRVPTR